MTRAGWTTLGAVIVVVVLGVVQWLVTTPGIITYAEFRLMILAGTVALIVVLSARWVDEGPDRW